MADRAARDLAADAGHDLLEPAAVLAGFDRLDVGADEFDPVGDQDARFVQGYGRVERGLAAQRGEDRVGTLGGDHLFQDLRGDRLDVGRVGELRVGHDRGRIGVDQADPDAFLAQYPAGLGS